MQIHLTLDDTHKAELVKAAKTKGCTITTWLRILVLAELNKATGPVRKPYRPDAKTARAAVEGRWHPYLSTFPIDLNGEVFETAEQWLAVYPLCTIGKEEYDP